MSVGEIKEMLKSFTKFWFFSPEAIFETCQEIKESGEEDGSSLTTDLSIYRRYYKK